MYQMENINYKMMTKTEFENYDITHFTNNQLKLFISNYTYKHPEIKELDLSRWDTSNITSFFHLFHNRRELKILNVSNWNTSRVVNFTHLFCNCSNLIKIIGLETWNTSKVEDMTSCFQHCNMITSLTLPWNMSRVKYLNYMFFGCYHLKQIYCFSQWELLIDSETDFIFADCFSLKHLNSSFVQQLKTVRNNNNHSTIKELLIMLIISIFLYYMLT